MRAVTWQGKRKVSVEDVPDPRIEQPSDAIVRITSTNICGSDLHLYETLGAFMNAGDILGHEPMGIVEEVGSEVSRLAVGDRVVMPFQISCGHCFMCDQSLYTQCETTQVREQGSGAALFGYSEALRLGAGGTGGVPAGAARRQHPHQGPRRPAGRPLRLPVRRAADRLAGGRVRRRARRRDAGRPRTRADRRDGHPDRRAPARHRPGDRRGPGAGATGSCPDPWHRGGRSERALRRPRRDDPGADRWSGSGCRDRRRRDGGARVARRGLPADGWSLRCRMRSPPP